ncbi:MAG: TadE/TadG family type IV pilus assembly protein [Anaerolineae bacterium]
MAKWRQTDDGQALVEVALVLPLLLLLAFGVVAVGRVVQAQIGVSAVTREAARVAALAEEPGAAQAQGMAAGNAAAAGYGLQNGTLRLAVNPGDMARGSRVTAQAAYAISLADLPFLNWASVGVSSTHDERVDLYRSRWTVGGP